MEPVLRLTDISFRQGGDFCLSIENLELLPRRIYALTGSNGAGKSTLLRILALLTTPQQGTVRFFYAAGTLTEQRQKVTLVEQSPFLFTGSVFDNLAFGLKLRGVSSSDQHSRIMSVLEMVGLVGFERRKTNKLSGGEVQRVALARALVLQPEVLLLDEPTSNVDSNSMQAFEDLLRRLPSYGVTVVFSTHDATQPARLGSETIQIENGRLLMTSQHESKHCPLEPVDEKLSLQPLRAQAL